jgi:hypothetical protein
MEFPMRRRSRAIFSKKLFGRKTEKWSWHDRKFR